MIQAGTCLLGCRAGLHVCLVAVCEAHHLRLQQGAPSIAKLQRLAILEAQDSAAGARSASVLLILGAPAHTAHAPERMPRLRLAQYKDGAGHSFAELSAWDVEARPL